MTERMTHYERFERDQRTAWHSRFDFPGFIAEPMSLEQASETHATDVQTDVNNAYTIDTAHAAFDPMQMLEVQMAMMPADAQAEIKATLPGIYSWGEAVTVFRDQQTQDA